MGKKIGTKNQEGTLKYFPRRGVDRLVRVHDSGSLGALVAKLRRRHEDDMD